MGNYRGYSEHFQSDLLISQILLPYLLIVRRQQLEALSIKYKDAKLLSAPQLTLQFGRPRIVALYTFPVQFGCHPQWPIVLHIIVILFSTLLAWRCCIHSSFLGLSGDNCEPIFCYSLSQCYGRSSLCYQLVQSITLVKAFLYVEKFSPLDLGLMAYFDPPPPFPTVSIKIRIKLPPIKNTIVGLFCWKYI